MNRKIKITTFVLLILMFINTVCYSASNTINGTLNNEEIENNKITNSINTQYKVLIEDNAELLDAEEEEKLQQQMQKLTQYGNIGLVTINTNNNKSTSAFAESYYKSKFSNESGTIFVIDMKYRKIYIYSRGKNYQTITSAKAETITDNIYKMATKKQYYFCAKEAFEQINTLLEGGKIAEPMKNISNVVLSIMIALLLNFVIFKAATRNKAASEKEQIDECEQFFEHTEPEAQKTGSHSVYSPRDTGGSSGGGGGRWRSVVAGGRWRRTQLLKQKGM